MSEGVSEKYATSEPDNNAENPNKTINTNIETIVPTEKGKSSIAMWKGGKLDEITVSVSKNIKAKIKIKKEDHLVPKTLPKYHRYLSLHLKQTEVHYILDLLELAALVL